MEGLGSLELEEKKKIVKNELKRYDCTFESVFNRPPVRNEKEPMRPLYIYYKLIKQSLTKMEGESNSRSLQSAGLVHNSKEVQKTGNNRAENFQKSKSFEFSPKITNRSGLQLVPKKDALQINLLSPSDKNMNSIFFSPSNNNTIIKKRSPRFSVRSPSIRRLTNRSPSRKTEIQLFSFI